MLALWNMGRMIEPQLGPGPFLSVYLGSGEHPAAAAAAAAAVSGMAAALVMLSSMVAYAATAQGDSAAAASRSMPRGAQACFMPQICGSVSSAD
jgi:hypothetical protein